MAENKKKFNLIDLIIILVVLAVAFVGWQVFSTERKTEGNEIIYKVNILKTEEYLVHEIQIGDKLFDSVKNFEIGEIIDVQVTDAVESVYDGEKNEYRTETVPERKDILLTVKGIGSTTNQGTTVNGYELYIGKKMCVKGANFATEAVAWGIGGSN